MYKFWQVHIGFGKSSPCSSKGKLNIIHSPESTYFSMSSTICHHALDTLPSPRVFNTHMPYRWLPREHFKAGRKVVNVIRNPKDVAVSWYCHWHSSNELGCGSISWSEFFEEVVMGQCTSTNAFGCLYFNIICKIAVSKISCCAITYSGIYMFCCVFFQIKMHLEDISTFRKNYTMLSSLMKGTHFVPCTTKIWRRYIYTVHELKAKMISSAEHQQ